MPPKVWVISPEIHKHGGTEGCIAEQLERWRDRFDLTVFSMRIVNVGLEGARVVRIRWLPGAHLPRYVWWFIANRLVRLAQARREGSPDAVYSPGINALDANAMSVHIVFTKYWKNVRREAIRDVRRSRQTLQTLHRLAYWALLRRLESRVYGGAGALWAISHEDAREIERDFYRPQGSVAVIPYGVDAVSFSPNTRSLLRENCRTRFRLGNRRVGLLVTNDLHKKGVDLAIKAVGMLERNFLLAVAGNADHDQVLRMAHAAGAEHKVQIWPHTKNIIDYYAAADLLVAPSREDAFNLPVLEALACGLPVVVSSRAGVSELLEHEHNALILRDPEDPKSIAVAIEKLLKDPNLTERLSREGRTLAEQLTWDQNSEATAKLIEKEIFTPRILILAPDIDGPGGIERASRSCIRAFTEKYGSERVGLLTLGRLPSGLACRVLASGKPLKGRIGTLTKVRFIFRVLLVARRWKKNLVLVAAHPHLTPVVALASRVTGAPCAVWCHGRESWGGMSRSTVAGLKRASLVFAPSQFTARHVERAAGLPVGSVRVIHHGLSHEIVSSYRALAGGTGAPAVIAVARLASQDAYKGIDSLINVWPRISERVPEARLWVVGDGPDAGRLKAISATLMLDGRVQFFDRMSDEELVRLYGSASAFALPSRFRLEPTPEGEGFGLVYIEAGAAGLPVIGAKGGGVEDAIEHGQTGLLVDSDDPNDLEQAIVSLLTNKVLAKRMGDEGRRRAETEFSYEAFAERICGVVDELFAQRRSEKATG